MTKGGGAEPADDRELLGQVAHGSQPALEALYRRHEHRLFRYLTGLLGTDTSRAGEVTCETFYEVWQQAGRFRGDSTVATWIFGIARHKALTVLRRTRRTEGEEALAHTAADVEDPLERLSGEQAATRVRQALEALSPDHREVLELACYQDFSYPQIAELLGCPVNTVKTRAFYARRHLERVLAGPSGASTTRREGGDEPA